LEGRERRKIKKALRGRGRTSRNLQEEQESLGKEAPKGLTGPSKTPAESGLGLN